MAKDLIQFIEARRTSLTSEATELRQRIIEIEIELEKLRRVELAAKDEAAFFESKKYKRNTHIRKILPNTIMYDVLDILEENKNGLTAHDILIKINNRREIPIERTSLSPQLSRLKDREYVDLKESTWILIDKDWRSQKQ